MPPIYAVASFLSLMLPEAGRYCDALRCGGRRTLRPAPACSSPPSRAASSLLGSPAHRPPRALLCLLAAPIVLNNPRSTQQPAADSSAPPGAAAAATPYFSPPPVRRELYEALTIYAFTWFLLGFLEHEFSLSFTSFAEALAGRGRPQVHHLWPVSLALRDWRMGPPFIRAVQGGVLNYVAVRPAGLLRCRGGGWTRGGPR